MKDWPKYYMYSAFKFKKWSGSIRFGLCYC